MLLAVPIMHGMATVSDLRTLELGDFMLMNEILLVKFENERRAREYAERKARTK